MSDVRCWYPGFEWMSGRSACGIDYVAGSGPIAARVEDAQCRACLRSDLARGALEAHGLAQFDIQERERKIADQDERIRALTASASDSGCRCGCRSTGQADQIAELYRQISTIEAELNERKGQAMVWESDQLIIAELQQQIEKLAAEAIEAQDKVKHLELVARETLKAKLDACNERDRLAAENLQAKAWGPHKALRDAIEKAGFGGVDEYVIQRERELNAATALNEGAKGAMEYIARGPWKTVDEYVLSLESCLKAAKRDRKVAEERWFDVSKELDELTETSAATIARDRAEVRKELEEKIKQLETSRELIMGECEGCKATLTRERRESVQTLNAVLTERDGAMARLQRCQKQCAEIEVNRDEWREEAKQSVGAHERQQRKAEGLAADHARLLAEKRHADGRVDELEKELSALQLGPCPGEDMRDHVAAQAQANQPPPTKIPSECMHDWQPAFNLERAEFVPGVLHCASCGSTLKADQPRPKGWRTPKEEYSQIAVDLAQKVMDALGDEPRETCCDDVRIYQGHCESCGARSGGASIGEMKSQVVELVRRNNRQAAYIKELGGVLPLFGAPASSGQPVDSEPVPDPVSDRKADRIALLGPIVLLGKLVAGGAPDRGIVECRGCNCLLLESREMCKRCEDDVPF